MKQYRFFLLFFFLTIPQIYAQNEYIWPTDAGEAITSSFAESRPGRFHAGIDVKTWGVEGYKVFAIRNGYVSKIAVSPFGYGRVLYVTLDTGEIVVCAHLQRFNTAIQAYVTEAQQRLGRFTVQLFPGEKQFVVKKGDLLGFTGQTGVGYPHLHFEMRDKANRPMNPLLKGYPLQDTIPPTLTAVSITPLDANSMVDDDWRPAIFSVVAHGSGTYTLSDPVMASGTVAFGVEAYDRMNLADNKFGTYCNELYLDDSLVFRCRYDHFSYNDNTQSSLDRDYRLISRGRGTFYKLYRDVSNTLDFYPGRSVFYGAVCFATTETTVGSLEQIYAGQHSAFNIPHFSAGVHRFKIVLWDFQQNASELTGVVCAGQRAVLKWEKEDADTLGDPVYTLKSQTPLSSCVVYVSYDQGRSWRQELTFEQAPRPENPSGESTGGKVQFRFNLSSLQKSAGSFIIKAVAKDCAGLDSYAAYQTVQHKQQGDDSSDQPCFAVTPDYYDHFVRMEFSKLGLFDLVSVLGWDEGGTSRPMTVVWSSPTTAIGVWPLSQNIVGPLPLELIVSGAGDQQRIQREWLNFTTISRNQEKRVVTDDDLCYLDFDSSSLFDTIFIRTTFSNPDTGKAPYASKIYQMDPMDVPLDGGVSVVLKYAAKDSLPERLGVYARSNGDHWGFIGNRLKKDELSVSAHAGSLGFFCLMRDVTPPLISSLIPLQGVHLTTTRPLLRTTFKDDLSGIGGEDDMQLTLDGRKVVAEYDPEERSLFYAVPGPLTRGKHVVECRISDRSGNSAGRTHTFWID
jgi:hypothetical protein